MESLYKTKQKQKQKFKLDLYHLIIFASVYYLKSEIPGGWYNYWLLSLLVSVSRSLAADGVDLTQQPYAVLTASLIKTKSEQDTLQRAMTVSLHPQTKDGQPYLILVA